MIRPSEVVLRKWFPTAPFNRDDDGLIQADIGDGVLVSPLFREGWPIALIETHPRDDNAPCSGVIRIGDGVEGWMIQQESPLTLHPSIQCIVCTHHGFIREGKWVPA